jgi:DNA polymerase III subunit alpha
MLDRQISLFGDTVPGEKADEPVVSNGKGPAGENPHHAFEKTALGFYLSSHPLEDFEYEMAALKCQPIESIGIRPEEAPEESGARGQPGDIIIAGVITERKLKKDKNGGDYAILQIEDLTGTTEVLVFNKTFESCRKLAKVDELVIVLGKQRIRGENQASIWADAMLSLKEARGYLKTLSIRIRAEGLDPDKLMEIRKFLEQYPGRSDVVFYVNEEGQERRFRVQDLKVMPSTDLVRRLQQFSWVQNVRVNGALPIRELAPPRRGPERG